MFVRPHTWIGIGPVVLVFFLLLSLLVIAAVAGACVLIWRAVARHQPGGPPPGYGPGPGFPPPPPPPGAPTAGQGPTGPMVPARTVEERLADLDDLHERGVISDDEHRDARARILSEG